MTTILEIKQTLTTPRVSITSDSFIVEGESYPEDPKKFYEKMFTGLNELNTLFSNGEIKKYHFNFDFEYISTSSLVMIKKMMIELSTLQLKHDFIKASWFYYHLDEDMQMLGEELREITNVKMDVKVRP